MQAKGEKSLEHSAARALERAKVLGAQQADAIASRSTDFEVKVADRKITTLTQATSRGLGIRIFIDGRLGFSVTSDVSDAGIEAAVGKAISIAKEVAHDPHHGVTPAPQGRIDTRDSNLDLYDANVASLSAEDKIRFAHDVEQAARDADSRVAKFRNSGVSTSLSEQVMMTSDGATRLGHSSDISAWCTPVAQDASGLQTDFWYDAKTHLEDLATAESIGRTAASRATRMLGAKAIKTQRIPVIFEPSMAMGLLGGILGAIDGDAVYKKASFLADKLGVQIASPDITITDDPTLRRGMGSTPFDGEGLPTSAKHIVESGVLKTFLYDGYTARKAGQTPTGNARRGFSPMPHTGVFNFRVEAGALALDALLKDLPAVLIITRGLGHGLNTVSGEYSRGVNGLLVERGEVVHAVQEVTVAGNFLEMLRNIDGVGSDLLFRGSSAAPSIRIKEMMVSGL